MQHRSMPWSSSECHGPLQALRPCLLWMDVRASAQAARVCSTGDPALLVNGGGAGPVSAEWMIPKALWLKEEEPATYETARYICEYQVGPDCVCVGTLGVIPLGRGRGSWGGLGSGDRQLEARLGVGGQGENSTAREWVAGRRRIHAPGRSRTARAPVPPRPRRIT